MNWRNLPEGLPDLAQRFVAAARLIQLDSDGLPCNPQQATEVVALTEMARLIAVWFAGNMPTTETQRQLWMLADEWCCLMAAYNHSDGRRRGHHKAMGRRWARALAEAPVLLPAGPVAVCEFSDDIVEDRDPLADYVDIEGGYRFYYDGRPPEPVE
jgi:hypothetical protein